LVSRAGGPAAGGTVRRAKKNPWLVGPGARREEREG